NPPPNQPLTNFLNFFLNPPLTNLIPPPIIRTTQAQQVIKNLFKFNKLKNLRRELTNLKKTLKILKKTLDIKF
ncbi:hypothetical protein MBO_08581, partial [Moraxella bovoculi 237]